MKYLILLDTVNVFIKVIVPIYIDPRHKSKNTFANIKWSL